MLKIIGSIIIITVGIYISHRLCTDQSVKLNVTEALIDFTEHIRSSIYTSRLPLSEIYATFNDNKLQICGFSYQLTQNGLKSALRTVSDHLSPRSMTSLESFADNLGGINTDTQLRLCEETSKILREEYKKQEELFSKKNKMYKTLPILFATSIIIMMI